MQHLTIFGKKRKRVRPIVAGVPYLADWLNKHPAASNPEAPLFVKIILLAGEKEYGSLTYHATLQMIRKIFIKAGIKKPATLKIFRHSVNTVLYGTLPEEVVRQLQGHVPGSQMAKHYSHLNSKLASDSYSTLFDIRPKEPAKPLLMPRKCNVCSFQNKPEMEVCEQCKRPLSLKSALEMSSPDRLIKEAINEDNELLHRLEDALTERIVKEVEKKLHENEKKGIYGGTEI